MKLTDEVIRNAQVGDKPIKLFDGRGLFMLLTPNGHKWWRFKYRFAGKENKVSLGVYPKVSIAEARTKHAALRTMLDEGTDPSAFVQAERAEQKAEAERQLAPTRFMLDNDGALSFRMRTRAVSLNPAETAELRAFLDATRNVTPKMPCL
jgi:hypothetical protein